MQCVLKIVNFWTSEYEKKNRFVKLRIKNFGGLVRIIWKDRE